MFKELEQQIIDAELKVLELKGKLESEKEKFVTEKHYGHKTMLESDLFLSIQSDYTTWEKARYHYLQNKHDNLVYFRFAEDEAGEFYKDGFSLTVTEVKAMKDYLDVVVKYLETGESIE